MRARRVSLSTHVPMMVEGITWNRVSPIPAKGPIIPVLSAAMVSAASAPVWSCRAQSTPIMMGAMVLLVLKNWSSVLARRLRSSSSFSFLIMGSMLK